MKKKFILFDFDDVMADSFRPAFEIQKMFEQSCIILPVLNFQKFCLRC